MESKNPGGRTLFFLISAALVVVALIALIAHLSTRQNHRTGITLPSASAGLQEDAEISTPSGFVSVTPENAQVIVGTLRRPETYHQTLYKQIISDDATGIFTVHIWSDRGIFKLILSESGQTRHILTDGETVFLWYEDDPKEIQTITLPEGVSVDDLSGIPTYETILNLTPEEIPEADYRPLSDQSDTPCLYVCSGGTNGSSLSLWVDLSSGLLCKAERVQDGKLRYSLHQTDLVVLDASDAALNQQLLLPDGSDPFASGS